LSKTWIRTREMFEGYNDQSERRFEPIARVRIVETEDEPVVLAFGFDAWGEGRSLEQFIESYGRDPNHLRGTRYLLETLSGTPLCNLNTLRFKRGLMGIASVATSPAHRGQGHARQLLKVVMELKRLESGEDTRFLLFSEVNPKIYEDCGFQVLGNEHQHFSPSIAMATGTFPLAADEGEHLKRYF
jgi:GNAT superfamily N-acetyltransferase